MCNTSSRPVGRPQNDEMLVWFNSLCTWLESGSDTELYTIDELHAQMRAIAGNGEVYGVKRLKQRLQERYGDHVMFAEMQGRKNFLCFRNMANYIINDKWYSDRNDDATNDAYRIIDAAAKVFEQRLGESFSKDEYPSVGDITDIDKGRDCLTPSLNALLARLIPSNCMKQVSIGQAIIQAMRPKTAMTPILFGLGIETDRVFGSKWLVDEPFRLGFSISYDEVILFKQSVVLGENLQTLMPPSDRKFTQWVSDNADHNNRTLTGEGTFHGMGTIAIYSEDSQSTSIVSRIKRKAKVTTDELVTGRGVHVCPFAGPHTAALSRIIFDPILTLQCPNILLPDVFYSNLLWQTAWLFNREKLPVPNWSGFMQHIFQAGDGDPVEKAGVLILPIIDLSPSDNTRIYSNLLYIQEQASRLNLPTVCVTLYQPIWLKAIEIVKAKEMTKGVLRLGGFHLLMSACGSVFKMMKGSGIEEALEEAYGPNAVTQMTSGKAIAIALRGLFLVDAALSTKLVTALQPTGEVNTNLYQTRGILKWKLSLKISMNQWTPITDKRYYVSTKKRNWKDSSVTS